MFYVGVMSGTSCDGVDVVVVDFNDGIEIKAAQFFPYSSQIKNKLSHVIANKALTIAEISQLDAELGHFFGHAINDLIEDKDFSNSDILAIGLHGQTVCHQPPNGTSFYHNTLQIGSAAITAQSTKITTVAGFRQLDMAFGGQGAPLAPALHQHIFSKPNEHVVVLNLGGIANITSIRDDLVLGFDTGPANCLLDEWIHHTKGLKFDESGQWASQGKVIQPLLDQLLSEPYFQQNPPKSTGRELFNINWLKEKVKDNYFKDVDVQRTLLQLTVESITSALKSLDVKINQLIVCGGGIHNKFMINKLANKTSLDVQCSSDFGVDPDYVEALLMAWLAKQNREGIQLDLSKITGSRQAIIYGVSYNV